MLHRPRQATGLSRVSQSMECCDRANRGSAGHLPGRPPCLRIASDDTGAARPQATRRSQDAMASAVVAAKPTGPSTSPKSRREIRRRRPMSGRPDFAGYRQPRGSSTRHKRLKSLLPTSELPAARLAPISAASRSCFREDASTADYPSLPRYMGGRGRPLRAGRSQARPCRPSSPDQSEVDHNIGSNTIDQSRRACSATRASPFPLSRRGPPQSWLR
jgi:hypothetical protein